MTSSYQVIIAGLGAMGSAAAYHLARRGHSVLGLDRFAPPHTLGSTHGQSRIIREAYFEHPAYVPIVQRAYALWAELETESQRPLFRQTGGVVVGAPDSSIVTGAIQSARLHNLPHEVLDARALRARFPAFRPRDDMAAVWEPRAGALNPELCVEAHLKLAAARGAALRTNEPVLRWQSSGSGVRVTTPAGDYRGDCLLVASGPWMSDLLGGDAPAVTTERQVQFWFEPRDPGSFDPANCPVYLWEHDPGVFWYGFPNLGQGVKVANHHRGEVAHPDAVHREVGRDEVEAMRGLLERFMPGAAGEFRAAATCIYTNTSDHHFLIDRHPAHPRVLVASPCSGHGFKFAAAIGEILADLVSGVTPAFDLSLFRWRDSRASA